MRANKIVGSGSASAFSSSLSALLLALTACSADSFVPTSSGQDAGAASADAADEPVVIVVVGDGGPSATDAGSPDASGVSDAAAGEDAADNPDAVDMPDAADTPDAVATPDAPEAPDATTASDAEPTPDATTAPDATGTPDAESTSDAAAPLDSGPTCAPPTTLLCSGACVDPTQPAHCGGCSAACAAPPSTHGQATCTASGGGAPSCGVACSSGYHACGGDCLPDSDSPSVTSDPCILTESFGVFVSPQGSNVTGDGSRARPYKSIGKGMDAAVGATGRVYACGSAGSYTAENLVVGASRDGVHVYGGLDCSNPAAWTYAANQRAVVAPAAAGFALQISGLTSGVAFEDMEFDALGAPSSPPASGDGASSIAVFVDSGGAIVFTRGHIQAGSGQPGGPGKLTPYSLPAASALAGNPGEDDGGGLAKTVTCPAGDASTGGAGTSGPGVNGDPGLPSRGLGAGTGGNAAINKNCALGAGHTGGSGGNGADGPGASALGNVLTGGWQPKGGSPGLAGQVAQGGGGGVYTASTTSGQYGFGGSGGAGGCGGAGGGGGGGGGASIAVLSAGAPGLTLQRVELVSGVAGQGGAGAAGQAGEAGGRGGAALGMYGGCPGGDGGSGGSGGAGGGGAGGISAGVVYHGLRRRSIHRRRAAISPARPAPWGPEALPAPTTACRGPRVP